MTAVTKALTGSEISYFAWYLVSYYCYETPSQVISTANLEGKTLRHVPTILNESLALPTVNPLSGRVSAIAMRLPTWVALQPGYVGSVKFL